MRRNVQVILVLSQAELRLLECVRAGGTLGRAGLASRRALVVDLVLNEARRLAARRGADASLAARLLEAVRDVERSPRFRPGRPMKPPELVPGPTLPPPEEVRPGGLFIHAELRWPGGTRRLCRVTEVNEATVAWCTLRRNGSPLDTHRTARQDFLALVAAWQPPRPRLAPPGLGAP